MENTPKNTDEFPKEWSRSQCTENKSENPEAFPGSAGQYDMTLRDYFANSVDGKDIINKLDLGQVKELMNVEDIEWNLTFRLELEAKVQYMKADAMLKAREL